MVIRINENQSDTFDNGSDYNYISSPLDHVIAGSVKQ